MVKREVGSSPRTALDLRSIRLFSELEDRELDEAFACLTPRRFKAGETIILSKQYPDAIGIVWSGVGQMYFSRPPLRSVVLARLTPGRVFGVARRLLKSTELGEAHRVRAQTDMVVLDLKETALNQLIDTMPTFAKAVLRETALLSADLGSRLVEMSALSTQQRLRAELLRLARDAKWEDGVAVIDPVPTQQEIADQIGCAREVVTRGFKRLAEEGVIKTGRGILQITNAAELLARDKRATGRVMFRLEDVVRKSLIGIILVLAVL